VEHRSLRGRTLFITGSSRGIGLAIALRAAKDGANIAIAAKTVRPHPRLPGTIYTAAEEIERAGGKALPLQVDVRSEEQVAAAVAECVRQFGGLDILVNNASAIQLTRVDATELKRYDLMQDINARGTFLCAKSCLPHLIGRENPHVFNTGSSNLARCPVVRPAYRLHGFKVRHGVSHLWLGGRMQGRTCRF